MSVTATVKDVVPAVKAGMYPARFDDISEKRNEQGPYWFWTFTVQVPANKIGDPERFTADADSGYALIPITATTSPRITPRTKAAKWIEALRGNEVEVDEEIDFDDLTGGMCYAIIEIADTGYSRIQSLMPAEDAEPIEGEAQRPAQAETQPDDLPF